MGRGRAKAKQTKVARDLKYNSGGMDIDRLRADLQSDPPRSSATTEVEDVDPELLARYGDDSDDDDGYATGR
jgi:hypothetical protein